MHILHVFDHSLPLHSGYTFRSRAILREQRNLGWTTCHLTSPKHNLARPEKDSGRVAEEEVDGLRFYRSVTPAGFGSRLPVISQYYLMKSLEQRLEEVARKEQPDIIQAHSPALNAIPAVNVGRRLGIPVVYEIRAFWEDAAVSHGTSTEGGLRYRLTRGLETRALRRVDAITCICEGIRGDILARGIPAEKITIIPNAVDIARFEPVGARDPELAAQLGLGDKPVVGFIGSFYAYEGIELLLDVVPRLVEQMPGIQVLLVGGGPTEQALKAQVKRLGIGDRVQFTGRVPHDQVDRYYSLIDVSVYARHSQRITELVTPLKPLESMAQKCLFVASDVGGHKELVRDGETGVLFKADDMDDLSATVVRMFNERERWPILREAGRQFVERERNWASSVARYKQPYEQLVAARNKR